MCKEETGVRKIFVKGPKAVLDQTRMSAVILRTQPVELAPRFANRGVHSLEDSLIFLADDAKPRFRPEIRWQGFHATVRRPVVNQDKFNVRIALCQHTSYGTRKVFSTIENRHPYRHKRFGTHEFTS